MVDIPWSIYRDNMKTQWSDQWEFILFKDETDMVTTNLNTLGERIISWTNGSLSIPESRIISASFPTPFAEFKSTELPNKMNVYNQAEFNKRDVSITFNEDTSFTGYQWFSDWFDKVYDKERRMFKPEAETVYRYASVVCKKKGRVNNAFIDRPSMRFNLHRLKITGFTDMMNLDHSKGEPLQFTANMKVEKVTTERF